MSAAEALLLVIDATTDNRVATELCYRGRSARSIKEMGLARAKDPELLMALQAESDWVLVTGDDRMPDDHGGIVEALRPTIATVDPKMSSEYETTDQWRRDVIHKWAHKMQTQPLGTIRRYNLTGSRPWHSRTRRAKAPATTASPA